MAMTRLSTCMLFLTWAREVPASHVSGRMHSTVNLYSVLHHKRSLRHCSCMRIGRHALNRGVEPKKWTPKYEQKMDRIINKAPPRISTERNGGLTFSLAIFRT
ncbi:hypothetical protein PF002_g29891 [Phytophthora fragariae]|uniref:Secreted protein n=1 Tax=Phytophthora fragariae TaxID=53985 RepID=A0A6A3W0M4_9STRA|nr:hypothetical protein PF011_g28556 [Phytophthora fragariae]KAE9171178.1 hypothetical protein PF002_g29891 [Phytophthora fragariae]